MLTQAECRLVSHIEQAFPGWEVYPDRDYPSTHLWHARRLFGAMVPITVGMIGDLPGEIGSWIREHSSVPAEVPAPREGP